MWNSLSDSDRELAIRGARGYRSQRLSTKKPLVDPEKFLRNRDLWTEFASKPVAADLVFIEKNSPEGRGIAGLFWLAGASPFSTTSQGRDVYALRTEVTPQMAAVGRFISDFGRPADERTWWDVSGRAASAWREFLTNSIGRPPRAVTPGVIRVPRPFPPRVDGSWLGDQQSELAKTG